MDGLRIWQQGRHWLAGLMVVALAACGGSGGGSTYVPPAATPSPTPLPYISNAVVSTFAGPSPTDDAASFAKPYGMVKVGTDLYVTDTLNHTIRKIELANNNKVSTIAGSPGLSGSADGTGSAARFYYPWGITSDGSNLYVTNRENHTIRKIVIASGEVSTLAGTADTYGRADGTSAAARFSQPAGIVRVGDNLFVADWQNHAIRQIVIAAGANYGKVTTLTTSLSRPMGIVSDGTHLFVTDASTIKQIRIDNGTVTLLAGSFSSGNADSSDGTGTTATFYEPNDLVLVGTNLYITDTKNNTVRQLELANNNKVTTLAGTGSAGMQNGTGTAAAFYKPGGIIHDGGNLYIADRDNNLIRKIEIASKTVSTFSGSIPGTDGAANAARFNEPAQMAADADYLYLADQSNHTIRRIALADGSTSTLAGSVGSSGNTDAAGAAARFNQPFGIVKVGTNLYVTDMGNHKIRKIDLANNNQVSTLAGSGTNGSTNALGTAASFDKPTGIATDGTYLYVTDTNNHTLRKIAIADGASTTHAGTAGGNDTFSYPQGVTLIGTTLYVADTGNDSIRKVSTAGGAITTLAGTARSFGHNDGDKDTARFNSPTSLNSDGSYLYVVDSLNHLIRKVSIATGQVNTVAGSPNTGGYTNATGAAARFFFPKGILLVGNSLYVTDTWNNSIRKITGY